MRNWMIWSSMCHGLTGQNYCLTCLPVVLQFELEDLLAPLAKTGKPVGIAGDNGKIIGFVDAVSVVAGLASLQDDTAPV